MSRRRKNRKRKRGRHKNVSQDRQQATTATVRQSVGGVYQPYRTNYCCHWREPVHLLDELTVYASAHFDRPKVGAGVSAYEVFIPDIGFYMDEMWAGSKVYATQGCDLSWAKPDSTARIIYPWMDAWVPDDAEEIHRACEYLLKEIASGKTVDFGCLGGHGRTGTMLASLLVVQGLPAWRAVEKIRRDYCDQAVETVSQERFVMTIEELVTGETAEPTPDGHTPIGQAYAVTTNSGTWGMEAATSNTYKPSEPQGVCPVCHKSVYFWPTHHETHIKAGDYKVNDNNFMECVHGCGALVYNHLVHDKYSCKNAPPPPKWGDPQTAAEKRVEEATQHNKDWEEVDSWLSRKTGDDDADYAMWQRLNAAGDVCLDYPSEGRRSRLDPIDEHCVDPPCMYPGDCDPETGDCWKSKIMGSMEIKSAYLDFKETIDTIEADKYEGWY